MLPIFLCCVSCYSLRDAVKTPQKEGTPTISIAQWCECAECEDSGSVLPQPLFQNLKPLGLLTTKGRPADHVLTVLPPRCSTLQAFCLPWYFELSPRPQIPLAELLLGIQPANYQPLWNCHLHFPPLCRPPYQPLAATLSHCRQPR